MKRLVLMLPKMIIPRVLNTRSKTGVLRAQIRNTMCGHRLRSCEARKKERKRERLLISLGVCTRALEIFFFISRAHIYLVHIKNCRFETTPHIKIEGGISSPILFFSVTKTPSRAPELLPSLSSKKKGDRYRGGYPHGVGDVVVRLGERRRRSVFVQLLAGRSPIGAEMRRPFRRARDAAETHRGRAGTFLRHF